MPDVQDGLDDAPTGFDHVRTLKERWVTGHAITQQALIAGVVFGAEIGFVIEVHVDEAELHDGTGDLCAEA